MEELKKQIEEIESRIWELKMTDHWTSEESDEYVELVGKLRKLNEELENGKD